METLKPSSEWIDLVPISDLESDDVEFQKSATHIQIRYYYPSTATYSAWTDLVALADLKGDTGDSGVYIGRNRTNGYKCMDRPHRVS